MRPRERPRSGPTGNRFVVESALGQHLSMRVLGCSPSTWAPAYPLAARRSERRCRAPSFLDREVGPDLRQGERAFTRASLGLRLPTDLCNAWSTRGHAREPWILLRARLPPLSAFGALACARNPTPLARDPPPRSPATDVSIRCELRSSGAVGKPPSGTGTTGIRVRWGDDAKEPCLLTTLSAYPSRGRRLFRGEDGSAW